MKELNRRCGTSGGFNYLPAPLTTIVGTTLGVICFIHCIFPRSGVKIFFRQLAVRWNEVFRLLFLHRMGELFLDLLNSCTKKKGMVGRDEKKKLFSTLKAQGTVGGSILRGGI